MKTAVLYQSRGGNTRAVAEVIAEAAGTAAHPYTDGIAEYTDRLFLGGGAYKWDADPAFKKWMDALDPQLIGELVAFSTAGGGGAALAKIIGIAKAKGINVSDRSLLVKMGAKGNALLLQKGGALADEHIAQTKEFVAALS